MEKLFKKIEKPLKPVPQELKAKVMKDIAFARLLMELASLFSINLGNIVEKTIKDRN